MKNNKMTGWKNVFSFTFSQIGKSKSFLGTTIFLSLVIFGSLLGFNVYRATKMDHAITVPDIAINESDLGDYSEEDEAETLDFAKNVYVLDESGLGFSLEDITANVQQRYSGTTLMIADKPNAKMKEEIESAESSDAYVYVSLVNGTVSLELYLPKNSMYTEGEGYGFLSTFEEYVQQWKYTMANLNEEQESYLDQAFMTSVNQIDEESVAQMLIDMYVPMGCCLILYMCIILYGQMVGNSVATEKSSKVMELLLTSVRPLAIIVGKVLGTMALALVQLGSMIVCGLVGNYVGTILGQNINSEYTNTVISYLTEYDILGNFSVLNIILALFTFVLGFTFYCSFAGLMGATVNRGEDLSSAMSVFTTVSVFGFLFAYMSSLGIIPSLETAATIIPISSPFILPAKFLLGKGNVGVLAISTILLFVFVIAFLYIVAKVYEIVIMFSGNKIGIKQICSMFKEAKK